MKKDAPRRRIVTDAVDLLTADYEEQEPVSISPNRVVNLNMELIAPYGEATSGQIEQKLDSRGRLAKEYGLSDSSIARLIRVNQLIEPYKRMMDNKEITMQVAINLSYLSSAAQNWVFDSAEKLGYRLNGKTSAVLRSERDSLTEETIQQMMLGWLEDKAPVPKFQTIKMDVTLFSKYFKPEDKAEHIQQVIVEALERYYAVAQ